MKTFYSKLYSICFLSLILFSLQGYAQGYYPEFGKNRVQYHDFEWSQFPSPHFHTYFYQGGRDLAKFVALRAEENLIDIENKLEYQLSERIEIMLYNNNSDINQTNIGVEADRGNSNHSTRVIGNKVFIYFNGDHQHLERQVREGIARVFVRNMMFGDGFQEKVQNTLLLSLPSWFEPGLVSFIGEEWSPELDNRLRDGIRSGRYKNFQSLSKRESTFAGHALWHYVSENHGRSAIPNLLYLVRINRNAESGFMYVVGNSIKSTIDEWYNYYAQIYELDEKKRDTIKFDMELTSQDPSKGILSDLHVSPSGDYVAYSTSRDGKWKVLAQDVATGEKQVIYKGGYLRFDLPADDNYPLIAFSKSSEKLAIIYDKRDKIYLSLIRLSDKTEEIHDITKFEQLLDFTFTEDEEQLVFSAVRGGQTDLFLYKLVSTKVTQLTNDFYDDLEPEFYESSTRRGILFSSNRVSDTLRLERLDSILPIANYDIFFYDLDKYLSLDNEDDFTLLGRMTQTELTNETSPQALTDGSFSFLSDESGIYNRYGATLDKVFAGSKKYFYADGRLINNDANPDSLNALGLIDSVREVQAYKTVALTYPMTFYNRNIIEQAISGEAGKSYELFYADGRFRIQSSEIEIPSKAQTSKNVNRTPYKIQLYNQKEFEKEKFLKAEERKRRIRELLLGEDSLPDIKTLLQEDLIDESDIVISEEKGSLFQSEFDDEPEIAEIDSSTEESVSAPIVSLRPEFLKKVLGEEEEEKWKPNKAAPYRTMFSIYSANLYLDNTLLFNTYEPFSPINLSQAEFYNVPLYKKQNFGGLMTIGVSDLMENYKLTGGFKIPFSFSGSEYFLDYQALKKRIDKRIYYHRKVDVTAVNLSDVSQQVSGNNLRQKLIRNNAQFSMKYALDVAQSFRLHVGYVGDLTRILWTTEDSRFLKDRVNNWALIKLEYVFDNSYDIALNIKNGSRAKAWFEFYKPFTALINDSEFQFDLEGERRLFTFGTDLRHYQKLYKEITLASRFSMGASFGTEKVLYYLGGVENWIQFDNRKRFDYTTPVDNNYGYAFQTLATSVRGWKTNVRNGDHYALFSTEVRIPVFEVLKESPVKSNVLRNFQLVPFVDFGMAWRGSNPFSDEAAFTEVLYSGVDPISPIEVRYFRNPIVSGLGIGARTKVLGYFLKYDLAWGFDNGDFYERIGHLSFGLDF